MAGEAELWAVSCMGQVYGLRQGLSRRAGVWGQAVADEAVPCLSPHP